MNSHTNAYDAGTVIGAGVGITTTIAVVVGAEMVRPEFKWPLVAGSGLVCVACLLLNQFLKGRE